MRINLDAMKAFTFALFLFLVPIVLKAQRVQVGFNAGPTINYRILRSDSEMLRKIFEDERAIIRYSVGVDVALKVGANWQIGTGLLYGLRGFNQRFQQTDENGSPLPRDLKIQYHFNYLDVPVWVKYRFGVREQQSLYVLAGITNSFFLREKTVVRGNASPWPDSPPLAFRPYIPGTMIGIGIHRTLSEKISVEAGPHASLQLQNVLDGNPSLKRLLYTAGLTFRAAYNL